MHGLRTDLVPAEGVPLSTAPRYSSCRAGRLLRSKYSWYCEEPACGRLPFFESTPSPFVDKVMRSGTAGSPGLSRLAVNAPSRDRRSDPAKAARHKPAQRPKLGIDACLKILGYFQDLDSKAWTRSLDENHSGFGNRQGPGAWRTLRTQDDSNWLCPGLWTASDRSRRRDSLRKAVWIWLSRTVFAVDHAT